MVWHRPGNGRNDTNDTENGGYQLAMLMADTHCYDTVIAYGGIGKAAIIHYF